MSQLNTSLTRIEPIALRIGDAARYAGLSKTTLYVLIGSGVLASSKVGARRLILRESFSPLTSHAGRPTNGAAKSAPAFCLLIKSV